MTDSNRRDNRRDKLSDAKKALLAKRLQKGAARSGPVIPLLDPAAAAPLSSAQRRIWFLQQLDPAGVAYNMHQAFLLEGPPLAADLLRRSLQILAARHSILRTGISETDGQLRQSVDAAAEVPLYLHHLTGDSSAGVSAEFAELALRTTRQPFELQRAPLWRLVLADMPQQRQGLILVMHHIISDEWSVDVFWQELGTIYSALATGREPQLGDLTVQYRDYSAWEQQWLSSDACAAQLQFWRAKLAGEAGPPGLPMRSDATADSGYGGAQLRRDLPADVLRQLEKLAISENASLFMALAAVYSLLLYRYGGQRDLLIGTPVSTRSLDETRPLIGFFLNTLVLRLQIDPQLSFRQHLRQVRHACLEAFGNSDIPFDMLVRELQPHRDGEHNPWFDTMLVLQKDSAQQLRLPETRVQEVPLDSGVAKFGLTLFVTDSDGEGRVMAEYRRSRFSEETIEQLLRHWTRLLLAAVATPEEALCNLPVLDEAERRLLLEERNNTADRLDNLLPLHLQIEQQAAVTPAATALCYHDQTLDYAGLNRRANQLAHYLLSQGAAPGQHIGIYLDRSLEYPQALLAILKTGAAYVPLDPAYPADRLAMMIEDAGIGLILSQTALSLPAGHLPVQFIQLDRHAALIARQPVDNPPPQNHLQHTAYVIFTSGSTGRPKGVVVSHANLCNSTHARCKVYPQVPRAYLLLSSFAFDSSVAGIFRTLAGGGTLCIPHREEHIEPDYLCRFIREQKVSHLLAIPSFYRQLLQHDAGSLQSLQCAIVAGEACTPEVLRLHRDLLPGTGLYNEYGPTEATVWSSVFDCRQTFTGAEVPIGKPVANTRLYVLDAERNLLPDGLPGELYIGGANVAQGYIGNHSLTAERFLPDPFCTDKTARMYRTGDRVRWLPDGNMQFLGRVDGQIKMRGFRIELAEIEVALLREANIREAIVVAVPESAAAVPDSAALDRLLSEGGLAAALAQLGEPQVTALLREVEMLSPAEISAALPGSSAAGPALPAGSLQKERRTSDYLLKFAALSERFICPPRLSQRNWLIGQWFSEAQDDLEQLHRLAQRFVPGSSERGELYDAAESRLDSADIMEDWQTPIMKAMARQVTATHGDVLEIGFGLGVSAGFIQDQQVRSHTIVEMNDYIAGTLFPQWRAGYPQSDIRLVQGRWQDVLDQLESYDGVFFHAVPANEEEFMHHMVNSITFAEHFFPVAASLLRPGGTFTYLTTEIDSLSRRHQRALFSHFSSITLQPQPLVIPPDTHDLWWADSMLIVKAVK